MKTWKMIAVLGLLSVSSSCLASASLPLALFVPGTLSATFVGLAEYAYEYKASALNELGSVALKLGANRPELGEEISPTWFALLLAEPFVRDIQSPYFATQVVPKMNAALARLNAKHHRERLSQFPVEPRYQAAALRAVAIALRAGETFLSRAEDQQLARGLCGSAGRIVAGIEAGTSVESELQKFRERLAEPDAKQIQDTLIQLPRTRGLGKMLALAHGYLG